MANIFITSSNCCRILEMYGTYTLQAATALSCESSAFLFSLIEFSAYIVHSWQYWRILYSASSWSMTSADPAIFFTLGILSSFSLCIVLVSCSPHSMFVRNSGSNFSCLHLIPMSSGGLRYVYTCNVLRSNSEFDVLKNSLSGGQLNNILPYVDSSGSLSFIRSPTLVLHKSGTYQSRAMVPCCHTNSLMASSLVLCNSTVGFIAGFFCALQLFRIGFVFYVLCHGSHLNACVVVC